MIPVFKPVLEKSDIQSVTKALKKGEISVNFGKSLYKLEKNFAKFIGSKYAVAVSSGTTALHLSVAAFQFEPGSEILVSSTTNIATALAITHNNCIPVPIDSSFDTWNINLNEIEKKITSKTKAIIVVHFLGNPIEMKLLNKISKKYNLKVIEDAAEAHGAEIEGQKIGSLGNCGCFSFYANKIISSGEGGIITTDDKKYYEKLQLYRNLGFTNPRFVHFVQGFNFRMTGYQAALANNQLKRIKEILKIKKIFQLYKNQLNKVSGIKFQKTPNHGKNVYWMVGIYLDKKYKLTKNQLRKNFLNIISIQEIFLCLLQINHVF